MRVGPRALRLGHTPHPATTRCPQERTPSLRNQFGVNIAPRCSGHAGGMTDPELPQGEREEFTTPPSPVLSSAASHRLDLTADHPSFACSPVCCRGGVGRCPPAV